MNYTKAVNCIELNKDIFPLKKCLQFIKKHKMLNKHQKIVLGLSGGIDSVFLLIILKNLLYHHEIAGLTAIHINHGTRIENKQEEIFVTEICKQYNVELKIIHLKLDHTIASFEDTARKMRYEYFVRELKCSDDLLATAHHLNDSFEWSLMNLFKTSTIDTLKGIPQKRNVFIRPILSFSKKEIIDFCKLKNITFMEDISNLDCRYERNFVRNKIIPLIEERFPQYLKHFSLRSNLLQMQNQVVVDDNVNNDFYCYKDPLGGVLIQFSTFNYHVLENIKKSFFYLSNSGRSSVSLELSKIEKALQNGRQGPLTFPSNIDIYLLKNTVYLIRRDKVHNFNDLDLKLLNILKNKKYLDKSSNSLVREDFFFPQIYILNSDLKNQKVQKEDRVKQIHPLLPLSTDYMLSHNILFNYFSRVIKIERDHLFPITLWSAIAKC